MKKSDTLRAKIAELSDEAEALVNVAEKDGRDLSAEEQTRWSALMAKDTGEVAKLQNELQAAVAHEEEVARLRALRLATATPIEPTFDSTGTKPAASQALPPNVRVVNPRLAAFKGQGNREQALRDAYDSGLWFKALFNRHDKAAQDKLASRRGDWVATLNESTPTDGGYLVPPQFEQAVIVYREQVGALRKIARIVQMSSDTYTFVKQTAGTTVYYPAEEGSITASSPTFGRVSLTAKKRAILSYISNELNDDAMVSAMDLLASDMGHQFALKEDQEGIAGDGTSTYGGVQGIRPAVIAATASVNTAATGNDLWSEQTVSDLAATMSKLSDVYRSMPLSWLCSGPFKWQVFDRLALAQGGALTINLVDGQPQPMFMGYQVVISDRMPTTTAASTVACLFGAFGDAIVLGERAGIRVAVSEHVGFTTDQIAVRATTRYDIKCHQVGDTSTAGAVAGHKTAA